MNLEKTNTNTKWVPLKNGIIPPVGQPLIVTVLDHINQKKMIKYPVFYEKDSYENEYGFYWHFGDMCYKLITPDVSQVLAYQELPKPYECDIIK